MARAVALAVLLGCLGGRVSAEDIGPPPFLNVEGTLLLRSAAEPTLAAPETIEPAPAAEPDATGPMPASPGGNAPGQLAELYEGFEAGLKPIQDISVRIDVPADMREMADWIAEPGREYFDDIPPSLRDASTGLCYGDAAYGPMLNFCYRPLYFEEPNFERYGHHRRFLQPAISAAKFYRNTLMLPYRLIEQRPGFCTYYDHHYRPGAAEPPEWPHCGARSDRVLGRTAIALQRSLFAP